MSTIAIPQRNAGDTILASFFNDLRAKWIGDVVGFDVNGNPTSGNNLGNPAYPFGTLYATAAVIGGVPFSTSTLERPPYQIVSGKTRSGSNQPAFLSPAGSSPSFSLLASATNLQLVIKGVSSTWTLDKNSIPVTTAPSTGNTCAVNDATAAAQAATRTWGEYGSGSPYYAITVSGMGASISARVGSFQAFKVGTEYFVAFVESTTSLSRAFRGYFFDSSGNPVKRATFSNGATITLMNLGFVFADQDGTTVDTIFVGAGVNNAPTYGFTAPSSPATGDYWYDQGNSVWKRWSSAAWLVVNRILVGLVVADGTNCVAARSFDFFGLCRSDNTIELAWSSNTVVKGAGLLERVNVNGNNVYFTSSRAVWDTAANLAASTDRYNATVQASTTEYFYVTDSGDTKISDVEPYYRADLLGWYHPYNPWRQVGSDVTDGSAHFASSTIANSGSLGTNVNLPGKSVQAGGLDVVVSAANPANGLSIIRGVLNWDGSHMTKVSGEGFTVVDTGASGYQVTFNTAFADEPSVVALPPGGAAPPNCIGISSVSTTGFTISSKISISPYTGGASGGEFHFIVIGQRA